jgi:hypothetical protein
MTQRFTVDAAPELEQRLEQWCGQFAEDVRRIVPVNALEAIVLGGGYGRGEGGVLRMATGEAAYNDLEFYTFVRGPLLLRERKLKSKIGELCHRWSDKSGVEFEAKLLTFEKIQQAPVSMFYYDLVVGHRWLFGNAGEFQNCDHHRSAHRIPLDEATRLLMNRSSGLLFSKALLEKGDFSASDTDFVRRNISKAQLALGDVVLTAFGRYHYSCRERHRRLEKLDAAAAAAWLPALIAHHEIGVEFKLHPYTSSESVDKLRDDHAAITNLAGEVFLWLEQRRLNTQFVTHRDYAFGPIEKHPDPRRLRNALINLRAFGPRHIRSRYPRERLLESLALLLWMRDPISDANARRKLQSDLVTDATTLTGFVEAYRKIWNRFN